MSEVLILPVRKKVTRRQIFYRLLIVLVAGLALVTAGKLIFQFVLYPALRIQNIDIKSDIPLSREALLALAGIKDNEYYFSINCETIRHRLEAYPLVKEA